MAPISDASQLELLRLLRSKPELTQREAASALGVSVGKFNYCLRALIGKGLVKAENYRNGKNRLAYLYLLPPSGIAAKAELTRRFLARKMNEYEALRDDLDFGEVGVRTVAIHPQRPEFVYLGTDVGVFASEDGGESWSELGERIGGITALAVK